MTMSRSRDEAGELANEAALARSQGAAHCKLAGTPGRTGKLEIGDVDAGDQQREADRAEQHQQKGPWRGV
jgi:hypothetical protein